MGRMQETFVQAVKSGDLAAVTMMLSANAEHSRRTRGVVQEIMRTLVKHLSIIFLQAVFVLAIVGCSIAFSEPNVLQVAPLSESEAVTIAESFCHKIEAPFDRQKVNSQRKTMMNEATWRISTEEVSVFIDENTRTAKHFSRLTLPKDYVPVNLTEPLARVKAERIRSKLGKQGWVNRGTELKRSFRDGNDYVFQFIEHVNGDSTYPWGNHLTVNVQKESGHVMFVGLLDKMKYSPKSIQISEEQAKTIAGSLIQQHNPQLVSPFIRSYSQYILAKDGFGCTTYPEDQAQALLRYAYCVEFKKATVFVDAKSGKSLGGLRSRSPRAK